MATYESADRQCTQATAQMPASPQALIIGAGPAGLACAVTLRQAGIEAQILEKSDRVGASWRLHYDRLHLHTHRRHSGLPG